MYESVSQCKQKFIVEASTSFSANIKNEGEFVTSNCMAAWVTTVYVSRFPLRTSHCMIKPLNFWKVPATFTRNRTGFTSPVAELLHHKCSVFLFPS